METVMRSGLSRARRALQASRGRGTGFAGPQAQRPPWGAERYAKRANVGATSSGRRRSGRLGGHLVIGVRHQFRCDALNRTRWASQRLGEFGL